MIYLNGTNSVILTLREKSTLSNPYYTWIILDKETKLTYTYSVDNYSNSPYFDAFTISNTTGSPTQGHIPLSGGEYEYTIYQKTTQYDLNILPTDIIVENGIMIITNTYSNTLSYTQSSYKQIYTYRNF